MNKELFHCSIVKLKKISNLGKFLSSKQSNNRTIEQFQDGFIKITKRLIISYIIISIVFFGTGLIYLFNPFGTSSVEAAWFNDNWGYRKAVPISSHTAAETTKYISVTISGTDTLVTNGQLQSDCGDMRFTKQNGDLMPYYIVSGCNSSSTVIHVYFDSFPAGAQTIYFYYGNPSVSNGFSAADFASEAASYVVGTVGSAENAPPPTLYWKFDDAQGTTANDSTPNALNGTLNNTPTWQTEDQCIAGKCLYFSLNGNKSVSRADDPKLDFAAADNFTVSLWIKHPGAIAGTQNILSKATGSPYAGYKIYMDASGDLCFDTRDGTNGADSACTSAVDFDDDAWHFVQGVKAGTTSITLYVDGKQRAQDASIVSTGSLANSGTLYAGIDQDGTSNDWFGFIDEVKIFRDQSARTISQVQADYNARSNPEGVSAALGANTQNMPAALSQNLVGYWKMDESATPAVDSSGNGNSGTWTGNVASTTGKFANGTTYDGTGDYLAVTNSTSLQISGAITYSAWVNPTTLSNGTFYAVMGQGGLGSESFDSWIAGTSKLVSCRLNTDNATEVISTTQFTTGSWNHFACVFVPGVSLSIYVNGKLEATTSTTTSSLQNPTQNIRIGSNNGNSSDFNGKLDEARIYNRSLSANDISQLYNWAPGPVGYWKMDESAGTAATATLTDSSGNGNNLTTDRNSGNYPLTVAGKYNKAFDPASNTSDHNRWAAKTDTSALDVTGPMTISAWVKSNAFGCCGHTIISKGLSAVTYNSSTQLGFQLGIYSNGTPSLAASSDGTFTNQTTTPNSGSTMSTNTWYYVTGVYNGTTLSVYINGVLNSSVSYSSGIFNNTGNFTVGGIQYSGGGALLFDHNGLVDDVKYYNYARTQAQIIEDMNGGHPAPGSPVGTPLGRWRFDEGYGTTANNYGNQGTLVNGTLTNFPSAATSTSGWSNAGKFGKGLIFEGSAGSSNDYVTLGTDSVIDNLTGGPMTLSAWIYPLSAGENSVGVIMSKNGASSSPSSGWIWQMVSTSNIKFSVDGATDLVVTSTGDPITLNAWNHVSLSWNGTFTDATTVHMYVNGKEVSYGTQTNGATIVSDAASSLLFGNVNTSGLTATFAGTMDELKIYNQALTVDQIKLDLNRSSSEVLGATGTSSTAGNDNASTRTAQSNASAYCIPGDSTTCTSPVGEWKFDEGSGTSSFDTSGNGYTGTFGASTAAPTITNGKFNKAVRYDGTDDYNSVGAGFTPLGTLSAMTAETWVNFSNTSEKYIVASNNQFDLRVTTNNIAFSLNTSGGFSVYRPTVTIAPNTWNHIVGVYDGSQMYVYLNGKLVNSQAKTGTIGGVGAGGLIFGAQNTGAGFMTGIIDQATIYNYARTPAQIAWDYNQGKPIAQWKMDECSGTTINDLSGNSNTGTLTIGASGTQTTAGTCNVVNTAAAWYNGVTGKRNYSLNFDGTDDEVNAGSASMIDDLAAGAGMTLSAWIYPLTAGEGSLGRIFDKTTALGPTNGWFFSMNGSCTAGIGITVDYATTDLNAYSGSNTTACNTWQHVVVTWDGSTTYTNAHVYVNGIEKTLSGNNGSGSRVSDATASLRIGNDATGARTFDGQIDDTRVYNYPLTATQVKSLYNDGATRYGPVTGAP